MSQGSVDLSHKVRGGGMVRFLIKIYYMIGDVSTMLDIRAKENEGFSLFPCFDRSGETSRITFKEQLII